jgi:hypothetical protein
MHKVLILAAFAVLASAETMDSDGIPDWWEATRGLCCTNAMDAFEDPDGDWLINLHEYWHDLDPFVLDGTNTELSVMTVLSPERDFMLESVSFDGYPKVKHLAK